ncbi:hypothetical protein B0H66DRAFT_215110 [Apodospora peruviana]|uniref:Uncharacterized protein n=1 Tax=Apodospora peruviana TaxID=516989 RepID=A0AAE0M8H8_9PEZI|nr:hypothetical protein B0H66DRAFT_215110 [Apodospora peruviana]
MSPYGLRAQSRPSPPSSFPVLARHFNQGHNHGPHHHGPRGLAAPAYRVQKPAHQVDRQRHGRDISRENNVQTAERLSGIDGPGALLCQAGEGSLYHHRLSCCVIVGITAPSLPRSTVIQGHLYINSHLFPHYCRTLQLADLTGGCGYRYSAPLQLRIKSHRDGTEMKIVEQTQMKEQLHLLTPKRAGWKQNKASLRSQDGWLHGTSRR